MIMSTTRIAGAVAAAAMLAMTAMPPSDASAAPKVKGKCEVARSSGKGTTAAQARELAMQQLVEAMRDSGMKARGKITYACRKGQPVSCTARQTACRGA